jgi:hypothetical protein
MISIRSPFEMLDGCYHLPRFIDKTRLHLASLLPPEYEKSFCHPRGLDGTFLAHFQIAKNTIIGAVRDRLNDGDMAVWFANEVVDYDVRRASWAVLAPRLGLPGERMHDVLLWALRNVYNGCHDPAIDTVFKVLDWDEGRATKPPLPTPAAVTSAAGAPVAPPTRAAGL